MSYDYITEYSYGIAESLNLIAPRLFGGSNNEDLGVDSEMFQFIVQQGVPSYEATNLVKQMPTYWGDQPIVAAPAYIGIVVFFFFVLAFFTEKRKIKYILATGALAALVLSWGKNFALVTNFFIDYVPMYNKFRAVSSIQVLLELCVPALATLGLYQFFKIEDKKQQFDYLWKSGAIAFGILVFLFLLKGTFDFSGASDSYYAQAYGPEFMNALKEDRMSLYSSDVLRGMGFVAVVFGLLFLYNKNTLKPLTTLVLVGLLMVGDLFFIAENYVNKESFVPAREMDQPFQPTQANAQILQDTAVFRVFEVNGAMNSARASYFHQSIGGYHAAKPRRMQQLFDYHIAKNNVRVLNMLNAKYIIQANEEGQQLPLLNQEANGNAWFIEKVKFVSSADEEIKALDSLDTKNEVVINSLVNDIKPNTFEKDSLASIQLTQYQPNHLKYVSNNKNEGFAVFSEMYYSKGWKATVDGQEAPIFNVNYVLRGLQIPAGKHTIEFKFEPEVVKTGSTIALISTILMVLLVGLGLYFDNKRTI
jgi:hypothetical protein